MATSIGKLAIILTANATEFEKTVQKVEARARQFAVIVQEAMSDPFSALSNSLLAFGGGFGAIASGVVTAATGAFKKIEEEQKAIADQMKQNQREGIMFGVSPDQMGALKTFAKSSWDDLSRGLQKLQREAGEFQNVPMPEALATIMDRMKAIESPTERARLAFELFGKSGAVLIPKLSKGSEALAAAQDKYYRRSAFFSQQTIDRQEEIEEGQRDVDAAFARGMIGVGNFLAPVNPMTWWRRWKSDVANTQLMGRGTEAFIQQLKDQEATRRLAKDMKAADEANQRRAAAAERNARFAEQEAKFHAETASLMERQRSEANAIKESLKGPGEKAEDRFLQLRSLFDKGHLSQNEFAQATARLMIQMEAATKPGNVPQLARDLPGLEAGTQAARSFVTRSQDRIVASETTKRATEAEIAATVKEMLKAVDGVGLILRDIRNAAKHLDKPNEAQIPP